MSEKPQAPVRICRPNKPLTLEPYDGMRDPYTGDVYRIVGNKLVLEPPPPPPACGECGLPVLVDKSIPIFFRLGGAGPLCATCREQPAPRRKT